MPFLLPGLVLLAACASQPAPEDLGAEPPPETGPPVEATSAVDRAVATTGDVITYTVTVDYDPSFEVEVPEPGADIAGFRIIDLGREEPRPAADRRVEERWYQLRADLVGSYVLPPVTVGFRPRAPGEGEASEEATEGAGWDTVQTSAIFVEVESVLPQDGEGEATDIRDVKPLEEIPSPIPWGWILAAGGALLGVALGLFLWRRRPVKLPAPVPAHQIAFRELDELRATDFGDPAAVRRFYFRISAVLRTYVEERFGLNATDLTSEEIFAELPRLEEVPPTTRQGLEEFLRATDQVKFAGHVPSAEQVQHTYELGLGFVEATVPAPVEDLGEGEELPSREAA